MQKRQYPEVTLSILYIPAERHLSSAAEFVLILRKLELKNDFGIVFYDIYGTKIISSANVAYLLNAFFILNLRLDIMQLCVRGPIVSISLAHKLQFCWADVMQMRIFST